MINFSELHTMEGLMNVLLSIKPKFAHRIFDGTKRYEYRKVIFKNSHIDKIIVYASSPVKMVIGELDIDEIIYDNPITLWEKTYNHSGVDKRFFFDYFASHQMGYAIKIKSADLYDTPIDPHDLIEGFKAPQSFMYLEGTGAGIGSPI